MGFGCAHHVTLKDGAITREQSLELLSSVQIQQQLLLRSEIISCAEGNLGWLW